MPATDRIRVLIRTRGSATGLYRTLVSLACQTVRPERLELVLATDDPDLHASRSARLLHSALGFAEALVLDARELNSAQALNRAAEEGHAGHLALLPEGCRLHPRFLTRCLDTLGGPAGSQAVFSWHVASTPEGKPLPRRRPFRPEQLVRQNPVGPAALIQRTAWDILCGLKPHLKLHLWDFWLRLAMSGGRIAEIPELLASCPAPQTLTPQEEGRAKAMLVVSTPGAFEPDVCRWAMALLRGDSWAGPCEPGWIPGPRELAAMQAGYAMPLHPDRQAGQSGRAWSVRRRTA